MELHQLAYFVAIVEHGSFTRAARACHVAQPSLSQQVAKLERELGRPLFDRLGRRVELTGAGRALLPEARAILAGVSDARRRVADLEGNAGGALAIGAVPTVAAFLLPGVLRRFAREHAAVELRVHEADSAELVERTIGGRLDLAIVTDAPEDDRLESNVLFEEPLVVAVPRRRALARRRALDAKALAGEPFVVLHETQVLGRQVRAWMDEHLGETTTVCHAAQLNTLLAMVAAGLGLGLVPCMAAEASRDGRVAYVPLARHAPVRSVRLVRHRRRYRARAVELLEEVLRSLA
jgi:LysR family hydrogen peroxide-inducible transcriptional activator